MKLLVIRHAIAKEPAKWAETGRPDTLRPLTRRGRERMQEAARGLQRQLPSVDRLLTSPLTRAVQTAEIVAARYERLEPQVSEALSPGQPPAAMVEVLRGLDAATVAVVGHEPDLGVLVGWLLAASDTLCVELKKGAACLLELGDAPQPGLAVLEWLLAPGQLRRLGGRKADAAAPPPIAIPSLAEQGGGRIDEYFEQRAQRARTPGATAEDAVEIERKYLLRGVPPAARAAPRLEVEQGWLPGERIVERLRRVWSTDDRGDERWVRTIKAGVGVRRLELEEDVAPELGAALWPLTEGRRVRKRRYHVPAGERTWEIDEFTDRELVLAEVELPDEETQVVVPDWLQPHLVREVTGEVEYLNRSLAL